MPKKNICPVSDTTSFFNRKWIYCILADMFRGKKYFKDFKESNPTLSSHVLSQTLKYMEKNKLIEKIVLDNKTEYKLTDKGLKSNKILYEMVLFSITELECSKLSETSKKNLLNEYKNVLNIGD